MRCEGYNQTGHASEAKRTTIVAANATASASLINVDRAGSRAGHEVIDQTRDVVKNGTKLQQAQDERQLASLQDIVRISSSSFGFCVH